MHPTSNSPARVVLAVDRPGWAYHNIASQIVRHMTAWGQPVDISIAMADEMYNAVGDLVIVFNWKSAMKVMGDNRFRKAVVCLYDHFSWSSADRAKFELTTAIELADAVAVANEKIGDMLRHREMDTKPVYLVEDGVDREMFTPIQFPQRFTVGWCGNASAGHGAIKGVDIVEAACELAGVPLVKADLGSGRPIPHSGMPSWYSQITTLVCGSIAEGTPNPPLEAMMCGRPVISTRVGIMPRLIVDGVNGYIVDRTPEAMAAALKKLVGADIYAMGSAARDAAEVHAWGGKALAWRFLIRSMLGMGVEAS